MTAASRDAFVPSPWRVKHLERELPDTVTLDLEPLDGAVPPFEPGQFNMLYAFGVGEIAVSLSGDPADRSRCVHTVRAVGAVSTAISTVEPGATLWVRGPFGSAWPLAAAQGGDLLLIAGGLGLAPLRPAIHRALAERGKYRRVIVLIGMRSPAEILYGTQFAHWAGRLGLQLEVTVDRADPHWHGHVGVAPALVSRLDLDAASTVALVCGPEIMMRFAANALRDVGVAAERIHVSMERNMKCAGGLCGHCQFGPQFVCKDGPIFSLERIAPAFGRQEI